MASRLVLRIRIAIAVLALALPILALIGVGVGLFLFDRRAIGLEATTLWVMVVGAVGIAALLMLLVGRAAGWISWRWMLLLALPALAPLVVAGLALDWKAKHPSLGEISTDFVDPPAFSGVGGPYPAGLEAVQRARHPAVQSLTLKAPPEAAFIQALALARTLGWAVTSASEADGVLEGEGRFGRYKDRRRWVVRIRPELGGGSLVDMRLRTLTDTPDFGDNGEVVRGFLDRLKADTDAPTP